MTKEKFIKLLKEYVNLVGNDYYDYRDMLKKIDKLAEKELK